MVNFERLQVSAKVNAKVQKDPQRLLKVCQDGHCWLLLDDTSQYAFTDAILQCIAMFGRNRSECLTQKLCFVLYIV